MAGLSYSQNWAGRLPLPCHRWPSCLWKPVFKNACFLLTVCVGFWNFLWHQTESFEKHLSLKPVKESAGRQERQCCSEAFPWQRGRWSSKEESGRQTCMLSLRGSCCVWWWRFASERTRLSQCSLERIYLESCHLTSFGSSFCHISVHQIRSIRKHKV